MKKVSPYFDYVMRVSREGEVTYLHSAPCLHINPPIQDYWIAKAQGENPLHLGGVLYAFTEKGK